MVCSDRLKQFNKELLHVAHLTVSNGQLSNIFQCFNPTPDFTFTKPVTKLIRFFFFLNIIVYACNSSAGNENSQLTANLQSTKHPVLDFTVIF